VNVSAVLAVHDGARYLAESLDSMLAEPEVDEVIVVDDGSTDATPEILRSYGSRISVLAQAQAGQPAALNRGVAAASGELLAFQDADDLWPAGRISLLLAALATSGGEVDGAYGCVEQFLSPDADAERVRRVRLVQTPKPTPLLANTLLRRRAFLRVGPLDAGLRTGAALDWMSRARAAGLRFAAISDTTLLRRVHDDNLGRHVGRDHRNRDLLDLLRAHVQRQRAGGAPWERPGPP